MKSARRLAAALLMACALSAQLAHAQFGVVPRFGAPVSNSDGSYLYIVYLREDRARDEDARQEAPARPASHPDNREDFRGWHRPSVRALVKRIEESYSLTAVSMTSWAMPTFAAYVPETTLERLMSDPSVAEVRLSYRAIDLSTWVNREDGGETVPWGKVAIGTDDNTSTSNRVYVLDGWMQPHPDLTFDTADVNVNYSGAPEHALHVGGIVSARRNGVGVRGVNPANQGAKMTAVFKEQQDNLIQQAFDWVLWDAETKGIFAVANLSANHERYGPGGALHPYMRRVSNRVLLVESAGNDGNDLCTRAYGPARTNDGILVVGGIKANGERAAPYDNSVHANLNYGVEPGSNFGACVEVWGPSTEIRSTWIFDNYALLSGTSMAAPYVSGLASRHGSDILTRPVERESYIRSKLLATGFLDPNGTAIKVPSFTQPASFPVPMRLRVASITADAEQASAGLVNDGLYLNGAWNSGHFAPAWIEFDLGRSRPVASIRLTPEMYPNGTVLHEIFAGDTTGPNGPSALVATISEQNAAILEPLSATLNVIARHIRVRTTSSPSWVAWREIEIYGDPRTDELAVEYFYAGLLNRVADPAGYSYYMNQLRAARCNNPNDVHGTLNSITFGFVNSAEFQGQSLGNEGYVTALYKGLLRRHPELEGLDYYVGLLNAGTVTRENVRAGFVFSSEYYAGTVAPIVSEPCV